MKNALETGEYSQDVIEIFARQSIKQTPTEKHHQCQIFYLSLRHGLLAVQGRIAWCKEVKETLLKEKTND